MPRSRTRHKHHHHHGAHGHSSHQPVTHKSADHVKKKSKRRSAIPIMMAFIALLGLVIAFISAGTAYVWLATGIVGGAIVGYFIGRGMDKVAGKGNW
jgi:multidrug transporter EmrE-like cation transporter